MNNSSVILRKPLALLGVGLSLFAANAAFAQQAAATDKQAAPADTVKLEKFIVTGSYIPIAGTATAIPVTVVDSKAIENTGINTNVLDLLRKTMPQFTGNANIGDTNGNISSGGTGGGAQIAFRNVQTLVLINGRRAAYAPILASGGFQFVDVNLIPISAIDRIEVLQDGASAIYGTDAVSGVVNVILKTDYKGFEVGARFGNSNKGGHYSERKVWVVGGAGTEKTNITLSAEWTKTDPLYQYQRKFSNPIYGTATYPGVISDPSTGLFYVLKPGLNAPPAGQTTFAAALAAGTYIPIANTSNLISGLGDEQQYSFNLANYPTLLLRTQKQSVTLNFDHKATDTITLFGSMLYSANDTFSQLNAQPFNATIAAGDPRNPFTDKRITARNRFATVAPRQYYYNTMSIQGVIGLRGTIGSDWSWETAANKNRIDQQYTNRNLINTASRIAAVTAGQINLFAITQAPGAIAASNILGVALGQARSELTTYDVRINGKVADLPGGELGFAIGGDYRVESLRQDSDRLSQNATFGWDSATTLNPFAKARNIKSEFVDVRVPFVGPDQKITGLHLFEVEAAVRHEIYSDTEHPTVPKVSFRYLPVDDQFAFRGTYSKSFSAPSLPNLFGPGGIGFTSSLNLARFGGGSNIVGQANAQSGSNPGLKPSKSKNYTLGVVFSPKAVKGFSVTVDYFNIKQTDLVSTIGTATILQDVELNGTASPYANRVKFGNAGDTSVFQTGTAVTAAGQIGNRAIDQVYVTDTLTNIAAQNLSGIDVNATYVWNSDQLGKFDFSMAGGYYKSYTVQALPTVAAFETVGLASNTNGTIPRWTTYSAVDWSRGKWGAALGWQYIPSVTDVNGIPAGPGVDYAADDHVGSFSTFDLSVRYSFGSEFSYLKGLTVRVGANNVLDAGPPLAKGTFTQSNTDTATYGAVGRLLFVEAKYSF